MTIHRAFYFNLRNTNFERSESYTRFSLMFGDFGEDFAWRRHFKDSLRCLVLQCFRVDQWLLFFIIVIASSFFRFCQINNALVDDAF